MNKIIIVEDIKSVVDLYKDFLSLKGYEIVVSNTSEEFKIKTKFFQPELVIFDTDMPTNESQKFLEFIKNYKKLSDIPILLLTGFVDQKKIEKFRSIANAEFLNKNSSPRLVFKSIKKLIEFNKPSKSSSLSYSFPVVSNQ